MGKTIAFTSGKGGVGKSTVTAGVAQALAQMGKKTLAFDADLDFGNLDIMLGMQSSVYTLDDVISENCSLGDVIYKCDSSENLYFMAASISRENAQKLNAASVTSLYQKLKTQFDYILIDTAAGIGRSFEMFTKSSDLIVLVTSPSVAALRDAQRVSRLLFTAGAKNLRLVVNMVESKLITKSLAPDIDEIINLTGVQLLGLLPYEKKLTGLQNTGKTPLDSRKNKMALQLIDIASRIVGENKPLRKFW